MPFSPDVYNRIVEALRSRNLLTPGSATSLCALCGDNRWALADGLFNFQSAYPNTAFEPQGPYYPFLALICQNCGNTLFINVINLGLGEIAGYLEGKK